MRNRLRLQKALTTLTLLCLSPLIIAAPLQWQPLLPGLGYTAISAVASTPWGQVHAFRIDPKQFNLGLGFATELDQASTSVKSIAEHHNALIAVNGGFFSKELKPIGLRIDAGKTLYPIKNTSWWGIFAIKNHVPSLLPQSAYHANQKWDFAIQSGPRLVVNSQTPKLKAGIAERTALGITPNKQIIVLVTHNAPMNTQELAELLQKPDADGGLNCTDALNLDGGSSTQLYSHVGDTNLNFFGFADIVDSVMVLKMP